MDKPYREADPPKLQPGKIIQIVTSESRLYGLDEHGVVWTSYRISENDAKSIGQALAHWMLAIGIYTPPT